VSWVGADRWGGGYRGHQGGKDSAAAQPAKPFVSTDRFYVYHTIRILHYTYIALYSVETMTAPTRGPSPSIETPVTKDTAEFVTLVPMP
jgi:hypothetical protein